MSEQFKEYIVTLKNRDDLEQFYADMEGAAGNEFIPARPVVCKFRRPLSRNTHYLLSQNEANTLSMDPRVQTVSLNLKDLRVKVEPHASQTATWSRADQTSTSQKNWGLYRLSVASNIEGWGSGGAESAGNQSSTVNFTATGKNVDVVIIDEIAYPDHSEFGGRLVQYDWFANHNTTVWPENPNANYSYSSYTGINNHATHIAAIIGGATQGWAKEANIYNLRHDTSGVNAGEYTPLGLLIDYVVAFHNSKEINPETGVKNPTLVNCSWGLSNAVTTLNPIVDNARYPAGRGSNFSKVIFRGDEVTPESLGSLLVDVGFSGVCNNLTRLALFDQYENSAFNIVTTDYSNATVTATTLNLNGTAGLTDAGAPTFSNPAGVDDNDDAYWALTLPFDIQYCGNTFGPTVVGDPAALNVYVGSNGYVTFGNGSAAYLVGSNNPGIGKICISSGDRSCLKVWSGTTGVAPNRKFIIRYEGVDGPYSASSGIPNIIWEMVFNESEANRIELHIGDNACYRGEFTTTQLDQLGIRASEGYAAPYRDETLDADIQDAIDAGIIFVTSAGNGGYKIDNFSEDLNADYNNYFLDSGFVVNYHRGASPGASTADVICVGALDSNSVETRVTGGGGGSPSNTGPRVDVYAPGKNVISAIYDNTGSTNGASTTIVGTSANITNAQSASRTSGTVSVVTASAHSLSNGDIVTVNFGSGNQFNAKNVEVIVGNTTTFSYTQAGADVGSTSVSGTVYVGNLYQKYTGTSMAAAQVTGLLALALETYPRMTQAEAREYILHYAKTGVMTDTGNDNFNDTSSLLGGNNRVAFYYKERPDTSAVFPKTNLKVRPASGPVYPRPRIRRLG